jgi:hypothetical protein
MTVMQLVWLPKMEEYIFKMWHQYMVECYLTIKKTVIHRKFVGNIDHHIERNKPDSERQTLHAFSYIKKLDLQKKT